MKSVNLANLHDALAEVDGWVRMAEETFPSETVAALYQARAWEMLDCRSWEALCDSRGWSNFGLAIGARREAGGAAALSPPLRKGPGATTPFRP